MSRIHQLSLASLMALTTFASGCADQQQPEPELDPRLLYSFDDCDDLLGYAKGNAKDLIEQYGNPWGPDYGVDFAGGGDGGEPAGDTGGEGGEDAPQGGNGGGKDYSGTNVQEVGVDEPDLIKTDGDRILAVAQGKLHFVDSSGVTPQKRGSLELGEFGYDAQMFLHEDRVLLLERAYVYDYAPEEFPGEGDAPQPKGPDLSQYFPGSGGPLVRLVEVDISDPDDLRVVSNLYINGDLISARMIDGVARVVLRSQPTGLAFKDPWEFFDWSKVEGGGGGGGEPSEGSSSSTSGTTSPDVPPPAEEGAGAPKGEGVGFRDGEPVDPYEVEYKKALEKAKLYNLAVVEQSKVGDWLPHFMLEDLSQQPAKISQGILLDCEEVKHPGQYSGLSTLSVMTVDLNKSLALGKGVGVFAEGETVYASKDNLYVTTTPWRPELWSDDIIEGGPESSGEGFTSYVHKFSLASEEQAEYVASGSVRGRVRSQWSLSEHEGDLRLATTDQQGWDTTTSESFVSVLRQDGDDLVQLGQVGGLGHGEEIQGVRFIGAVGYVVTFRQIDPLFTIDLADPAAPKMVGELKIPGFSAYLHPIDATTILGVGVDGTEEGQTLGVQLSLFDVSDLKNPKRIHKAAVGDTYGWSEALFDPKAFLYWQKTGLALLPVESYAWDEETMTEESFSGALGYTIDVEEGIIPLGSIEHPVVDGEEYYYSSTIRRSLVIDGQVLTLSDEGLKASLIGDLSDASYVEF
ncbi:MAG: beta-propeller domain-containing protein [Myxococcales bacterium]|nr:beta-propeller domain-containing protein [Myxococcales bacterium]